MNLDRPPPPSFIPADKRHRFNRLLDLLESNGCERADETRRHIDRLQDDELIESAADSPSTSSTDDTEN